MARTPKQPAPRPAAKPRPRKPRPKPSDNGVSPAPPRDVPPRPPAPPGLELPTVLGSLHPQEREWLWRGYLPRGVVTVVTGPQGAGKTAFLAHAAYRETWGGKGYQTRLDPQAAVLWYSTEDDPRAMLYPRLSAAGVQLSLVHVPDYDGRGLIRRRTALPSDAQAVGDLAHQCGARLVVFDPLTSFLAAGLSPNDPLQVRAVMDALNSAAAGHNLTILVALHPRKGRGGTPLEWVSGSAAWTQAARQVVLLDRHPDRPGEGLLHVLKPCSAERAPAWRFRIALEKGSPVWEPLDECEADARELSELGDLGELEERGDALEWLRAELTEEREVRLLYRRWTEQGYGRSLWWRCRRKLGVKVTRRGTQTEQQTYLYIPRAST